MEFITLPSPAKPRHAARGALLAAYARESSSVHNSLICPRDYGVGVREAELWERLKSSLGEGYAAVWADQVVLADLQSRTVSQALADGVPCKQIWRAAWEFLELPEFLK